MVLVKGEDDWLDDFGLFLVFLTQSELAVPVLAYWAGDSLARFSE